MSDIDLATLSAASARLVETAAARVVRVIDGRRCLSGIIWAEGQVVTAEECLDNDEGLSVEFADGHSVPAELAGRDPSTDVALLRTDTGRQAAAGAAG